MGIFDSFSQLRNILQNIDLAAVHKLSQKVDLNKLMGTVAKMSEEDLAKMLKFMQAGSADKRPKPEVNGDF
ncbi:MAG TPA: acyl-CoA dehydrogenase, partial [Dyadobacter sp.]|nr:acyl-CoA dehydrogenase [Dyadobacter sp.]